MEDEVRVGRRGKRTAVKRFRWNRGSYETWGNEPTSMTSDRWAKGLSWDRDRSEVEDLSV